MIRVTYAYIDPETRVIEAICTGDLMSLSALREREGARVASVFDPAATIDGRPNDTLVGDILGEDGMITRRLTMQLQVPSFVTAGEEFVLTGLPDGAVTDPPAPIRFDELGHAAIKVTAPGYRPLDLFVMVTPALALAAISDRQFAHQLAKMGLITREEALAFVQRGEVPHALQGVISSLDDPDLRFDVEILLTGATTFDIDHPHVAALAAALGWTREQLVAFWRAAAAL
jgi:hypothetical protein